MEFGVVTGCADIISMYLSAHNERRACACYLSQRHEPIVSFFEKQLVKENGELYDMQL